MSTTTEVPTVHLRFVKRESNTSERMVSNVPPKVARILQQLWEVWEAMPNNPPYQQSRMEWRDIPEIIEESPAPGSP